MAQTNTVYDPDADEQSKSSPSDNDLRGIPGISPGEESAIDSRALSAAEEEDGLYNPEDEADGQQASAADLAGAEATSKNAASGEGDTAPQKLTSRLGGLAKNKWLLGGVAAGGGTLFVLFMLFILFVSSLKIPHLAQNITNYQFARLTRQFAQTAQRATAEKVALDAIPPAANDSKYAAVRSKFTSATGKAQATWAKLDKYRPAKVMATLGTENNFKLTYKSTVFGRAQLLGVTFNDRTFIPVKQGYTRFVPGLNSVLDFKSNVQLSRSVGPEVQAALRANEVGPIIRSITARQIRQKLGIGLVAWKLGNYEGKNAKAARLQAARDLKEATSTNALSDEPRTGPLKEGAKDAALKEKAAVANDKLLQQALDNKGVPAGVKEAINNALAKSGLTTALGILNPLYAAALPMCIVYDGSLQSSGNTIDNQTRQQQATYYFLASAADEQKNGSNPGDTPNGSKPQDTSTELTTAIAGLDENLGDVSTSNAVTRASTGSADTSGSISAEASAAGNFTLLNATLGDNAATSFINGVADHACPVITDTKVVIGIGIINVGLAIFSGGTASGAEGLAGRAAVRVTDKVSASLLERLVTRTTATAGRAKSLLFDVGKSTVKIASATVVAKLIVASKAQQLNSGLAQGKDLADIGDSGGGIAAGEIGRQGHGARPLKQVEVHQSNQADKQYVKAQTQQQTAYQRYLAVGNAASLVSKVGMSLGGGYRGSVVASLARLGSSILKPLSSLGSMFTSLGVVQAAPADTTYGNVQFGWSQEEEALIDSSTAYMPLENQLILDESQKEDAIAGHYGRCFKDSLGTLLSQGDIVRDEEGNVLDEGLCSPKNLGPNNTDKDGPCGSAGCKDLVFRWRLAQAYNTTIDQLTGIQDAITP